jgi:hypothetical protein
LSRAGGLALLVWLAVGCTPDFDDVTTVKDLRILGVSADLPEVLFDGGPLAMQPQLCPSEDTLRTLAADLAMRIPPSLPTLTVRPLVADPHGAGRAVHFRIVACVSPTGDITDEGGGNAMPGGVRQTIGRGQCPADAPLLGEGDAVADPATLAVPISARLSLNQALLVQALSQDPLGLIYGLPLTVQVTVSAGDERAIARKRVLLTVRLVPDQAPNQNPLVTAIVRRDTDEGPATPFDLAEPMKDPPLVHLGQELRLEPAQGEKEVYPTRIGDRQTGCVHTETTNEALRYAFYATAGKFSPETTNTEPPVFRNPGPDIHRLQTVYTAPTQLLPGESDVVRVWVVTRDERTGTSYVEVALRLVP